MLVACSLVATACRERASETRPRAEARAAASDAIVTVEAGKAAFFPPNKLRAGDRVFCAGPDNRVGAGVPMPGGGVSGIGDGPDTAMSIEIETRRDGSVLVICGT